MNGFQRGLLGGLRRFGLLLRGGQLVFQTGVLANELLGLLGERVEEIVHLVAVVAAAFHFELLVANIIHRNRHTIHPFLGSPASPPGLC